MLIRSNRILASSLAIALFLAGPAFAEATWAGQLDAAFGINGVEILRSSTNAYVTDLLIQPDGRIVTIGAGDKGWMVMRFRPRGRPDSSFSDDGRFSFDVNDGGAGWGALDGQGRIVVLGDEVAPGQRQYPAVARVRSGGHLDRSFSNDGVAHIKFSPVNETPIALRVAPNGTILLAATIGASRGRGEIVALRPDGTIDRAFGTKGRVILRQRDTDLLMADMFVGPRGGITAFGTLQTDSGDTPFMRRISAHGKLDAAFGTKTWDPTDGIDVLLAVGPDGDGWAATTASGTIGAGTLEVTHLLHNGAVDPGFAGDGSFDYSMPTGNGAYDSITSTLATTDGRILVSGSQYMDESGATTDVFVMRLTADGVPDPEFDPDANGDGVAIIDLGEHEVGWTATVDSRGGLLVGGYQGDVVGSDQFPMIMRILLH
jgi:uncharacterized delta-60 repeat protein